MRRSVTCDDLRRAEARDVLAAAGFRKRWRYEFVTIRRWSWRRLRRVIVEDYCVYRCAYCPATRRVGSNERISLREMDVGHHGHCPVLKYVEHEFTKWLDVDLLQRLRDSRSPNAGIASECAPDS